MQHPEASAPIAGEAPRARPRGAWPIREPGQQQCPESTPARGTLLPAAAPPCRLRDADSRATADLRRSPRAERRRRRRPDAGRRRRSRAGARGRRRRRRADLPGHRRAREGPASRRRACRRDRRAAATGGGVVLNFEGADLREVIRNILGDILGESYTIDPVGRRAGHDPHDHRHSARGAAGDARDAAADERRDDGEGRRHLQDRAAGRGGARQRDAATRHVEPRAAARILGADRPAALRRRAARCCGSSSRSPAMRRRCASTSCAT